MLLPFSCKEYDNSDEYDLSLTELSSYDTPAGRSKRNKRSFSINTKKWDNGRTLTIAFISSPTDELRQAIIRVASQWLPHINLTFDFVEGLEGDIRIETNTSGNSSSWLGNHALSIASPAPTMKIGVNHNHPYFESTVLHEFGHALSAAHEHLHPDANIPWDKPKVYAAYRNIGWTDAETDKMVLNQRPPSTITQTPYDPKSIMHYPVDNELTVGDFEVVENHKLSEQDIALMKLIYPKPAT